MNRIGPGKYGNETVLGVFADGDHFGDETLLDPQSIWTLTAQAVTAGTALVLVLEQRAFDEALSQSEALPAHVDRFKANPGLTPKPARRGQSRPERSSTTSCLYASTS